MQSALQELPPVDTYRTAPPKGFTHETASAAGRKGAARRKELDAIRKALAPIPLASNPGQRTALEARLSHLRRLQRQGLQQASASTSGTEMLAAAKAVREFFEMEMELLGRREAGKGGRSKGSKSDKPVAPDVTLPQ